MSDKRKVASRDLLPGLYVSELDRPWLETPFLFQGFPIKSTAEIEQLQDLCRYVYVDSVRSDPDALSRLTATSENSARNETKTPGSPINLPPRSQREVQKDIAHAFGDSAYPDERPFRKLLRIARDVRERSRQLIDEIFEDVRLGHHVKTEQARQVIQDMVSVIIENASAALWLTNLKKRDEYTHIHCMNVSVLAVAFGRHLGLSRKELELLGLGAMLHDVGKMRTPDAILQKPGRLTAQEFQIVKRHPEDGYQIMKATGEIPLEALEIIRFHHERLSGVGYPLGLKDEQVSLRVMITAIADVYDAMTSDRSYRNAITSEQALKILYHQAGRHFRQDLVAEFTRCIGIYPVGSLVELSTGAIGLVIASDSNSRLLPLVLLVCAPDGTRYEKNVIVNLAALADDPKAPTCSVRRVINPSARGLDVIALTESVFKGGAETRGISSAQDAES